MPEMDYLPRAIPMRVPACEYAVSSDMDNRFHTVELNAPLALSAAGLLAAGVMVNGSAVTFNTLGATASATVIGNFGLVPFDSLTVARKGYGRNITVVASAANTRTLTVTGYDYLGSKMQETLTINGTTTVQGLKAFFWIESLVFSSSSDTTTVNVGWGNVFGLPFAGESMISEIKNGAVAANAGTFTAALATATAATATNADVRGTYLPATVIPDGVNNFKVVYNKRASNLHGNAQFTT